MVTIKIFFLENSKPNHAESYYGSMSVALLFKTWKEAMPFPCYTSVSPLQMSSWKPGTFVFSFFLRHFLVQHLPSAYNPMRLSCQYFYTLDFPVKEEYICVPVHMCLSVCMCRNSHVQLHKQEGHGKKLFCWEILFSQQI